MKVGVVGSRGLIIEDMHKYIPKDTTEIVSGGASGVDTCAKNYAIRHKLLMTEFLPEYDKYAKYAPLRRNIKIIEHSDLVIAFWDGKSRGTKHVIDNCIKMDIDIKVYLRY